MFLEKMQLRHKEKLTNKNFVMTYANQI